MDQDRRRRPSVPGPETTASTAEVGPRPGRVATWSAVVAAAFVGAVATACGGDARGAAEWEGHMDTLAGGGVRVVNPAEGVWTEETAWHLAEDLRIGSLEGEGPELLGQVTDIAVDSAGRIYVLESQAHELRVFGPDGEHLFTSGGQGEGPGELNVRFGGAVLVPPDGDIWINNGLNRRWEIFDRDGEFRTTVRQATTSFGGSVVLGRDGTFYQQTSAPASDGERRQVVVAQRPDGDSLLILDTLAVPEHPDDETVEVAMSSSGNQIVMLIPVPFVHQPSWQMDPRGFFWVEPGDGYRLIALSTEDHDTLRIVEKAWDPVPVTAEEVDEAMERFESGALADADADVDRSMLPDHHPPMGIFRTDEAGNLWVRRTLGQDRYAWDVFDPEGIYLGEVTSDVDFDRLTVHAITRDAVYGVVRDDLGVPYVVRLRIREGRPAA